MLGSILTGEGSSQLQDLLLLDVTHRPMRENVGDVITKLIEHNTTNLTKKAQILRPMRTTSQAHASSFSRASDDDQGYQPSRQSRAEIDRMVQKTERFCAESESNKTKIEARHGLGSICSVCATL